MGQQLGGKLPLTEHTFEILQNIFPENLTAVFKSSYMGKLEKLFWFLTFLIAFVIPYVSSIMRTGFLMTSTCVHKQPFYLKREQKKYIKAIIK